MQTHVFLRGVVRVALEVGANLERAECIDQTIMTASPAFVSATHHSDLADRLRDSLENGPHVDAVRIVVRARGCRSRGLGHACSGARGSPCSTSLRLRLL